MSKKLDESAWMSYEDAMTLKKLMAQQEVLILRQMGLGWLIDFCSNFENNGME